MASTAYIAASANRFSSVSDISATSLVAFGSGRFVALWDASDLRGRGVHQTLPGHEGLVTCVKFAPKERLVSGDDKGKVKIWRWAENWACLVTVSAHTGSVSTMTMHGELVVTGGSDGLVKIWKLASPDESDPVQELQSLDLRNKLPISLAVATLPGTACMGIGYHRGARPENATAFLLAIGGTKNVIDVWTGSTGGDFVHALSLPGHDDWVRSLAFKPANTEEHSLVLASGSTDNTIRLWNIERSAVSQLSAIPGDAFLNDEMLESFEASFTDGTEAEDGGKRMSLKRHRFTAKSEENTMTYEITFDALLIGHEAGITSLVWAPSSLDSKAFGTTLLSTSTDSSVILWGQTTVTAHNRVTSLWTNHQRFGDVGGQRLGGFVGGLWTKGGAEVLAWGWSGGWRRWKHMGDRQWQEATATTGHNGPVRGLAWSPGGEYLMSTSLDQTTRIHAETRTQDSSSTAWKEIARPQVHGYDIMGGAFLSALRFASIGDEKVVRVFDAPQSFVHVANSLCDINLETGDRPATASVPPLGLSNKAAADGANEPELPFVTDPRVPFEGELAAVTLWPEAEKIFGHGYELISAAASHSMHLLATACKATTAEHAVIRLYDTATWQPYGPPLGGHNLTITRIAFSPDDKYILSVSRDRTWRLFVADGNGYAAVAADKSHGRVTWDCAWACEGHVFATASRDKTVSIWQVPAGELPKKWTPVASIKLDDAATAVAFYPADQDGRRLLAVGLESGAIHIFANNISAPADWHIHTVLDSSIAHVDHVYQLAWRPSYKGMALQLASCSEDGTLRVLDIRT